MLCTGFRPTGYSWLSIGPDSQHLLSEAGRGDYALPEDQRSGGAPQREPEHAACLGASLRLPQAAPSPGKHRLYTYGEVAALRDALQEGLSISSAVSRAREGLASDASALIGALVSYENERADVAIEATLALRSVERSVEEVLLPMLDEIIRRYGLESAAWAFAAHWASDWLRRAMRMAPSPVRSASIVVGDASRDELDADSPFIRALELFSARAGFRVLSLSARGVAGIGDAITIHQPRLVIVAGSHLSDDAVARWAYAIRLSAGAVPVALYRRGEARGGTATNTMRRLPNDPLAAQARVIELMGTDQRMTETADSASPPSMSDVRGERSAGSHRALG